jgi:hypothetical protein
MELGNQMAELKEMFPDVHDKMIRMADAEMLFTEFMRIMDSPTSHFIDGTVDVKLKYLKKNGKRFGF